MGGKKSFLPCVSLVQFETDEYMAEIKDPRAGFEGFTAPGAMDPDPGQGMEELWMGSDSAMPQPHWGAVLRAETRWKDRDKASSNAVNLGLTPVEWWSLWGQPSSKADAHPTTSRSSKCQDHCILKNTA